MIATKKNPRSRAYARPRRSTFRPSPDRDVGRSAICTGPPAHLVDAIFAEFHRWGIPASHTGTSPVPQAWPDGRAPAPAQPVTAGIRVGSEAVVVVIIDRSMVNYLFGGSRGDRASLRSLLRAVKARTCENRLCQRATATATALAARRLLIVCDAGRTSPAERTRAIRWVREVAHRIGYESSINGLHDLGTSYLVLVADTPVGDAARSVADRCRRGEAR
ncbi:hypothetical protein AB0H42_27850 [Nocardia sp. NPDC050799]|uniref:hypothetical protein n=1 Tax=Nocardia sp. NPDC050799 TaxID=3154842 RepID=UPI0033E6B7C9